MSGHEEQHGRRGASLVAVIGALVVIGLLVAAVARDVVRAQRATRLVRAATDAPGVAEAALLRRWATWPEWDVARLAPGETRAWSATEGGEHVGLRVVRLGAELFQLDARVALALVHGDSTDTRAAHRAQALLLGVRPAVVALNGAVVSGGDLLGDGLEASGRDTVPPGWQCAPPVGDDVPDDVPAVVAPHAALVQVALGSPGGVLRDDAAADVASFELTPADTLAPRHTKPLELPGPLTSPVIQPATDGAGTCAAATTAPYNWGDPARPSRCATHVPVVRVMGDLRAPAGRGQGVLVVEGDLELAGGYEHWGVVVVHGQVRALGAGDWIGGALLARGGVVAVTPSSLVVRHSACAVRAALGAAGTVTPVTSAAWREWW